jgi:hypothetical protein
MENPTFKSLWINTYASVDAKTEDRIIFQGCGAVESGGICDNNYTVQRVAIDYTFEGHCAILSLLGERTTFGHKVFDLYVDKTGHFKIVTRAVHPDPPVLVGFFSHTKKDAV